MSGNPATIRIVTELSGDGIAKARGQLDDLEKKLPGATDKVDKHGRAHKTMGELAGGAGGKINDLAAEFTGRLGPAGEKAQAVVEKVTSQMGNVPVGAAAAAGGLAVLGAALYKIGAASVEAFTGLADQTRKLQAVSGVTAEFGSVFVDAADDLGVGADTATSAMARLAKQAGTNEDALGKLGVAVARTKDGAVDVQATFGNVADAFNRTTDPAKRAELGTLAFGKSWQQMTPLLKEGSAGMAELVVEAKKAGTALGEDDPAAALELEQSMEDLHDSFKGVKLEIGRGLVPGLADAAEGLVAINEKINTVTLGLVDLGDAVETGFNSIPILGQLAALGRATKGHDDNKKAIEAEAAAARENSDATQEQVDAQSDVEQALKDAEQASKDAVDATKAAQKANDNAAAAAERYEGRLRAAQKAVEEKADAELAAADVSLGYEKATLDTSNALHDQMQKTADLDTAIDEHGATSEEARAAQAELEGQTIATKESFLHQADAAVNLASNQAIANGQSLTAADKAAIQRDEYGKLAQTLDPGSPLRVYLDGLIEKLGAVPDSKKVTIDIFENTYHSDYGFAIPTGGALPLAEGGPLSKGQLALVGEAGPELIVPTANGTVIPAGETSRLLAGTSRTPSLVGASSPEARPTVVQYHTWNVNSYGATPREFALLAERELRKLAREKS